MITTPLVSDYTVSDVSARSPDMRDREFAEFVADIQANGQLVPIWVRGDEVIDGRKRLAACRRLGIAPNVINLHPSQDAEAISRALNVLRTHYSPSQRAMMGESRAIAKVGGDREPFRTNTESKEITVERAAAEVGVSPSYISKARQVREYGAPEVADAVKAGALTLNSARHIVVTVPKEDQPAAVEKVVAASKGLARQTPARVLDGDARLHRAQPKKPLEQFGRALVMVDEGARVLLANAAHVTEARERAMWLATLTEARTVLTRTIKALGGLP